MATLAPARATAFDIGDVELVYTPPVETTLAAPDLRRPNQVWLGMFRAAGHTIDIEEMYATSAEGEPLEGVIDALEEAGGRGVRIRFLVEKKMLRASDPGTLARLRRVPNLALRIIDFAKVTGRDSIVHAKFIVVDGKSAYLGSQNFDWRSLKHVHELGVRIEDKRIAAQMAAIFEHDWVNQGHVAKQEPVEIYEPTSAKPGKADATEPVEAPAAPMLRLVASPPDHLPPGVAWSEPELIRLLGSAKREIRAQVMNYSPYEHGKKPYDAIDDALRAAARRGVKVKLLVANWSTGRPAIDALKDLSGVARIEIRVVTIPEAKQGFIPYARVIHSKYCTVDEKTAWIGTSNWEGGYLTRLRNLELIVANDKFAARVAALHEQLWASSYADPIDVDKEYPKVRKE